MIILSFDTISSPPSISIIDYNQNNEKISIIKKKPLPLNKSAELLINNIISTEIDLNSIDIILVPLGPAKSWTGLRIGLIVAKILAWSMTIPIIGIPLNVLDIHEQGRLKNKVTEIQFGKSIHIQMLISAKKRIQNNDFDSAATLNAIYEKLPGNIKEVVYDKNNNS